MDIEFIDFDQEIGKIFMTIDDVNVECEVLFTFDSDDTKKSYIGFTDNTISTNGKLNIYVQSFDPSASEFKYENITDEGELKMVNDVIKKIEECNE